MGNHLQPPPSISERYFCMAEKMASLSGRNTDFRDQCLSEEFRLHGLRAWEEFERTSLHLTGAEVDAWLEKLEAGQDANPPPCHV